MRKVIVSMTLLFVTSTSFAQEDFSYIHPHTGYAKQIVGQASPANSNLQKEISQTPDFNGEGSQYSAGNLKEETEKRLSKAYSAGRNVVDEESLTKEQRRELAIDSAIVGGRSSNEHRKLYNSEYFAKEKAKGGSLEASVGVTESPIYKLNKIGESECEVSDKEEVKEIEPEEYEVEIEDTRLTAEEVTCEEDSKETFYCTEELKLGGCEQEEPCPFNQQEGGLYTAESNQELMAASGGLRLKYKDTILELGNDKSYTYNVGEGGCVIKEFTAKFFIRDLNKVSKFLLSEVFENNILHVEINGSVVYNGLGGNDLTLGPGRGFKRVIHAGNGPSGTCGLNARHQHWKAVNRDILAMGVLKEGENHMKIKLAVHWLGHAGIKIDARKYCCTKWSQDRWEGDCPR